MLLTVGLFLIGFTQPIHLYAQSEQSPIAIVEYMKVKPGMNAQYMDCEMAYKDIHQKRVDKGHIVSWQLEQVLFPSGTSAEYDYLTITVVKDMEALETVNNHWGDLISDAPSDQQELLNSADKYRDLVKRELWTVVDGIGNMRAKYAVENFMQVPYAGWSEYLDMETKFVKPIHEKSVEKGNRAGWMVGYMVMPHGESMEYQASTIDFYDSMADMTNSDADLWAATYPGMSREEMDKRILSTRKLVKSETRMLVAYVE